MDRQEIFYKIIHLQGAIDMTTKLIEQLQRQKERLDEDLRRHTAEYKEAIKGEKKIVGPSRGF